MTGFKVILTATAPGGEKLALVEYPDGDCGLLRDGMPIPGMKWEPGRMKECTAELLRLGKLDQSL